jgi:hypothetical protein
VRDPPPSFGSLCAALHQDAVILYGGTLKAQADDCVSFLPREARSELLSFLNGFLERHDSGELRRVLRNQHVAVSMPRAAWWNLFDLIRERLASEL